MPSEARQGIAKGIDAIEEAYEFFLAYAAQGITIESESARVGAQLRTHLDRVATAVSELGPDLRSLLSEDGLAGAAELEAFAEIVGDDAKKAGAVVALVRAQESITSQLVDNLNASVHVRTLLTDLFILDEFLKLGVDEGTAPETTESTT